MEVHEVVTVVTEREEITLPVSASVVDDAEYDAFLRSSGPKLSARGGGPVLLATSLRDPELGKTVAPTVFDVQAGVGAGTKRFTAPITRGSAPDFFGEPPSDDEQEDEGEPKQ